MKPLLYPSFQTAQGDYSRSKRAAALLFLLFLIIITVLGVATIDIDHPFLLLDIESRALYVDEGFYADAAQNLKKFGQWDMPLDSRHWPGAPFLASIQSIVFKLFGVSLTAARLISISMGLISGLALYSISRTRFTPFISLGLAISALMTFNFVGFSRAAIADPTATAMSMLAILVFVRLRPRNIAIPLSLMLAYFAFYSKMYFLFALATLIFLWGAELLVLPYILKTTIIRRDVFIYASSVIIVALSYWLFRTVFEREVANFLFINGNKTPVFELKTIIYLFDDANDKMPYHTKSPYFLSLLLLTAVYFIVSHLFPTRLKNILSSIQKLGRAEWAIGTFFCSGYVMVGMLQSHKAHYHYFTILPVAFLAIAAVSLIFKGYLKNAIIAFALSLHLLYQFPYYQEWLNRSDPTSLVDASAEIAAFVEAENSDEMVPVIGEFSAQLSLYSDKFMSLDAKWGSGKLMCERVAHWRPQYHVNVVWPSAPHKAAERDYIASCKIVSHWEEISRYTIFKPWKDQIVLSRLIYEQ